MGRCFSDAGISFGWSLVVSLLIMAMTAAANEHHGAWPAALTTGAIVLLGAVRDDDLEAHFKRITARRLLAIPFFALPGMLASVFTLEAKYGLTWFFLGIFYGRRLLAKLPTFSMDGMEDADERPAV